MNSSVSSVPKVTEIPTSDFLTPPEIAAAPAARSYLINLDSRAAQRE